jgi:hypothetical protein
MHGLDKLPAELLKYGDVRLQLKQIWQIMELRYQIIERRSRLTHIKASMETNAGNIKLSRTQQLIHYQEH